MMKKLITAAFILVLVLTSCNPGKFPTQGPTLPPPQVNTTGVPDGHAAASAFLDLWVKQDYAGMYDQLNDTSKRAITKDDFTKKFNDTAISLTQQSMDYTIQSVITDTTSAKVAYNLTYKTALFGDIKTTTEMTLNLENGAWKVQWDDSIILAELKGGNHLSLDAKVPARGEIYDQNNNVIAGTTDAYAIGIQPGTIKNEEGFIFQMEDLTGMTKQAIKDLYKNAQPDWYIPVGEAPAALIDARMDTLSKVGGFRLTPYNTRLYYDNGVAPQVIGYTLFISTDQMQEYRLKGYKGDERIGAAGIEKWGNDYLTGKIGGDLYIIDPAGNIVTRLASTPSLPADNIYTTLNYDLQVGAQKSIAGFNGAVVVIERDTGRVLAMASSPGYDPNMFDPHNANVAYGKDVTANQDNPLLNRAAQSSYPLGSVFKIITMAAALESGLYTKDTTYMCGLDFTELQNETLYDWTYDHKVPASGLLTLPQGLMRSCNPFFWHIGLDLYRQNRPKDVSTMSRAFGLGSATGIGAVAEDTGSIPDPVDEGDAVQLAIGQGSMLVTPLQVVDFVAAVGNGGTLYKPQIIQKITTLDGTSVTEFKPEVRGTLPVKPENLKIIQDAMRSVVINPRGTAYYAFLGMANIPIYGKTGTATTSNGKPHAWFAGYTDAQQKDKPDIAVVVLVENGGEGSEIAAPIFRRIIEYYFNGRPSTRYPWETDFFVTQTPTSSSGTLVPTATTQPSQ